MPISLSQRFLRGGTREEGARREGINISHELITALDRYKVCIRERERSRKVLRNRAKCLPRKPAGNVRFFTDAFYMQSVAFARVSRLLQPIRGSGGTEGGDAGNFTAGLLRPTCLETRLAARNI